MTTLMTPPDNHAQINRSDRALWMTIRRALLMVVKAIEIYCGMDEDPPVKRGRRDR